LAVVANPIKVFGFWNMLFLILDEGFWNHLNSIEDKLPLCITPFYEGVKGL
jgi:hypothetical protein